MTDKYLFYDLDWNPLLNPVRWPAPKFTARLVEMISNPASHVSQITTFITLLRNIATRYGSLKTAVHHKCDAEIAQFASKINVLAIFTNDTHFLVFEGNWHVWFAGELKINYCLSMELVIGKKIDIYVFELINMNIAIWSTRGYISTDQIFRVCCF